MSIGRGGWLGHKLAEGWTDWPSPGRPTRTPRSVAFPARHSAAVFGIIEAISGETTACHRLQTHPHQRRQHLVEEISRELSSFRAARLFDGTLAALHVVLKGTVDETAINSRFTGQLGGQHRPTNSFNLNFSLIYRLRRCVLHGINGGARRRFKWNINWLTRLLPFH